MNRGRKLRRPFGGSSGIRRVTLLGVVLAVVASGIRVRSSAAAEPPASGDAVMIEDCSDIAGRPPPELPLVVAHRGASFAAPENTMAAFRQAWSEGADAIEGDFWLSADGEIVCLHDASLERVAGLARDVREMTLKELRALDVGSWKDERWRGEPIPTLREVLDEVPDGGRILIEIKDSERLVPRLVEVLGGLGVASAAASGSAPEPGLDPRPRTIRVTVITFNEKVVSAVKAALPEIEAFWLVSAKTVAREGAGAIVRKAVALGADGLDVQAEGSPLEELRRRTRAAGLELHVWTVNDIAAASGLRVLGVESITTDVPGAMREALGR